MKSIYLFLAAMLYAATSFAQSADVPVKHFAPMAAADNHDIITEQPKGELRYYIRSGRSTWATQFFQDVEQDGIAAQVVFSADGKKAYFKDIISHAATGAWVEGNIEGDKIQVPLGQLVYWWDKDAQGYTNYGMMLARVQTIDGSIQKTKYSIEGNATFRIEGDDLILEGTSGDDTTKAYDGLGLVYTAYGSIPAGEWSYYLDYNTVYTHKKVTPISVPDNLETELYSLERENTGHIVRIAFDGSDVYIQGASENYVPQLWMKGTLKGNKITFPVQFADIYGSYLIFFCGADWAYTQDEDGYWSYKYYWTDGSITFDYDPKNRTLSSQQALLVNNSDTEVGRGEIYRSPTLRPYKERAATPADPSIIYYTDYFQYGGQFSIMMPSVPLKDTEGNFIDPAKTSWKIFVDNDEPYTLYKDEYKYLAEDIDEVPYLFSAEQDEQFSRSYIYEKAYAIYIYQTGFDRIGVQTIYRGGGEEHRSKIGYYDVTHVNGIADTTTPIESFDLSGRPVSKGHKGLTITRMSDGRVVKRLQR